MKKVFVSGVFNVLHPGHIRLLQFAKECGNSLTVGLLSDNNAKKLALVGEEDRLRSITSLNFVDSAFIMQNETASVVRELRPDFVVKGKEHEGVYNEEKAVLDEYGGELLFSTGKTIFSSADLLNQELENPRIRIDVTSEYQNRRQVSMAAIASSLARFKELSVLVLGDVIVDEYIDCAALGMSQEDPCIVLSPLSRKRYIGGAGIVASHAASLGARSFLLSVCGDDDVRGFAEKTLESHAVTPYLFADKNRPTSLKERYRTSGKTHMRVSHLRQEPISVNLQDEVFERVAELIDQIDLLIFSDFNYGCLPQGLIERVTRIARLKNVFVAADSQSSSQIGDIARYQNIDLIAATEREARVALKNPEDTVLVTAQKLGQATKTNHLLLKLGEEGVLILNGADGADGATNETDQLEALNKNAVDVAGAGDSMLIATSLALCAGESIWSASLLGSIAAAIQVSTNGNVPISMSQISDLVGS
jgi:rfaE bifunctional protein kinase chain/domain